MSMTETEGMVNFETQAAADAYIEYGPSDGEVTKYSTSTQSAQTLFQFEIPDGETDFAPGDQVWYRARIRPTGAGEYADGIIHRFRLARSWADCGPWTMVFAADSRSSALGETSAEFKNYFYPDVGEPRHPEDEFFLFAGDWVNDNIGAEALWRTIRGNVEGVGREDEKSGDLPQPQALGNHEDDWRAGYAESRRLRYPLGSFLNLPFQQNDTDDPDWKERYYYFTYGKVLFIQLCDDAAIYSETETDGDFNHWPAQRAWLEKILDIYKYYPFKVIIEHTSVDESDPNHSDTTADHAGSQAWLLDLIDRYGVTIVGCGHYHGWRYQRGSTTETAGVAFLTATFGAPLYANSGTWIGQYRYMRFAFGWNEDQTDPIDKEDCDAVTVYLYDPGLDDTDPVLIASWVIYASDNPAPPTTSASTSQSTTMSTSMSTSQSLPPQGAFVLDMQEISLNLDIRDLSSSLDTSDSSTFEE